MRFGKKMANELLFMQIVWRQPPTIRRVADDAQIYMELSTTVLRTVYHRP